MAYLSYDSTGQWHCGTVGEIRSVHCKAAVTTEPLGAVAWSFPSGSAHNLVFQLTSSWPDLRPNTFLIHRPLILQSLILGTYSIDVLRSEAGEHSGAGATPPPQMWPSLPLCGMAFLDSRFTVSKFPREGLLGHGPTAQRGQ